MSLFNRSLLNITKRLHFHSSKYLINSPSFKPLYSSVSFNPNSNKPNWESLKLNEQLIDLCKSNKLEEPNHIQYKTLENLLDNHDTILESETGTGKTQAYVILALQKLLNIPDEKLPRTKKPLAIILVPNKELTWQVGKMFLNFSPILKQHKIQVNFDKNEFYKGNEEGNRCVFVGTPSNLFNNLTQREMNELAEVLDGIELCVLDEVDFLLSRSYLVHTRFMIPYLYKLVKHNGGVFGLVGATSGIRYSEPFNSKLLGKYFYDAKRVTSDDLHKLVDKLSTQFVEPEVQLTTPSQVQDWKLDSLPTKILEFINHSLKNRSDSIVNQSINGIIFCNSINSVKLYTQHLQDQFEQLSLGSPHYNVKVMPFHKEIPIVEREETLKQVVLTTDQPIVNLIVSTDILSRGIDLPHMDLVVQAELPTNITTYIHRSGRTARFNRSGTMICYISKFDGHLGDLILQKNINNNEENQKLDSMFSKRRSLNKKVKRSRELEQ